MSEIKKELIFLDEGDSHISKGEEYVITEDHSINDVVRFAINQLGGDKSDIQYLIDNFEA
jgi:hypothetical protein